MPFVAAFARVLDAPLRAAFRGSLPRTDGTFTAQLDEPAAAEVTRDSFGVPHISAATESDLFFLQGVVHGQDRMWQLHSARMLASGRLCEFAGVKALDLDRLVRQLGFRHLATGDLEALKDSSEPEAQAAVQMLEAFCKGINWALENTVKMMPVEFYLTGQRQIEPWSVLDTLTIMRLYGFVMCLGFQHTILRHALIELFGKERASAWTDTVEEETTIPHTIDEAALDAFRAADLSGALGRGAASLPRDQGSNMWAIHGSHTTTGKPILVGDPHLTLKIPSFWYEVHLRLPSQSSERRGIHAYGVGPPGIPGVFIGHNSFFATSITLAYTDVEDIFLERFRSSDGKYFYKGSWYECDVRDEEIIVKGSPSERCICRSTCHGAILEGKSFMQFDPFKRSIVTKGDESDGVSPDDVDAEIKLAYAGVPLRPKSMAVVGLRKLLFARSFSEFDRSLSTVSHVIALNFTYADVEGHIGYVLAGEVPRRGGARGAELLPLVGWTGEHDWAGFVQHCELPKAFDPPSGLIISANHKIVDYASYPHYLGSIWKSGYRAQAIAARLANLVEGGSKVSPDQMPAVLMDVKSWAAVEFVEELRSVQPEADTAAALQMLQDWDCVLSADSVPALLYQLVHSELVQLLIKKGCEALRVPPEGPTWEGLDQDTLCRIIAGDGFDPLALVKILSELQGHLHLNVLRTLRSAEKPESADGRRWWLEQSGGKDAAVNAAVKAAAGKLKALAGEQWGTSAEATWGSVHTCHIVHTISKSLGLPPGSRPLDVPSLPAPGDTNTLLQTAPKSLTDLTATASNVSLRVIFDLSDLSLESTNKIILTPGQSGQFNSIHYNDQVKLWSSGGLRPIISEKEAVRTAGVGTMRFQRLAGGL